MANIEESQIQSELHEGEKILWRGKPGRAWIVTPVDIVMLLVGLLLVTVVVLTMMGAISRRGRAPSVFSIPVGAIILYYTLGRIPVGAHFRSRTAYLLTDERVLIIAEAFGWHVTSLALDELPEMTLKMNDDGSGTIVFEKSMNSLWMRHNARGIPVPKPSLEMIPDARGVYDMIVEARRHA